MSSPLLSSERENVRFPWLPHRQSEQSARRSWIIGLTIALLVWGVLDVRRRGFPHADEPHRHRTDLTVYTEAGAAFFDGRAPYEVSNPRGWRYLYPPMFAMLMAPLHVLPMQDQVFVWFLVSLLAAWGIFYEGRRLVRELCLEKPGGIAFGSRQMVWLATAAVVVAALPALNCMQRGQVGVAKLYLLMLGLRLVLTGRTRKAWIAGGLFLAMPIVLKVVPVLPVAFLLVMQAIAALRKPRLATEPTRRRAVCAFGGVACGIVLFVLLVPAALVGWQQNIDHLRTWSSLVLTKADDVGKDRFSGNAHSARNQSLNNATYRLGNFASHILAAGPDDRLVESDATPRMPMDSPLVGKMLLLARGAILLSLGLLGLRLGSRGGKLDLATGFSLGCVAMLVVAPIARGHYFMFLAPAAILVPLWMDRFAASSPRVNRLVLAMAIIPAALSLLHYIALPIAGRLGLLGIGTTVWLIAAMVLIERVIRQESAGGAVTVVIEHHPPAKRAA